MTKEAKTAPIIEATRAAANYAAVILTSAALAIGLNEPASAQQPTTTAQTHEQAQNTHKSDRSIGSFALVGAIIVGTGAFIGRAMSKGLEQAAEQNNNNKR